MTDNKIYETEKNIISLLLQNECTYVLHRLSRDDFIYFPTTFEGLKNQIEQGKDVNIVTVYSDSGLKPECSISELATVMGHCFLYSLAEDYAEFIKTESEKRKFSEIVNKYKTIIELNIFDTSEKKQGLIDELNGIDKLCNEKTISSMDAWHKFIDIQDERDRLARQNKQMKIGLPLFDNVTAGFHRGELTCIAARTGVGKTAFALQVAVSLASNHNVMFASLEMSAEQLVGRLVQRYSGVDSNRSRNNILTTDEWERIGKSADEIKRRNFIIAEKIQTVSELRIEILKIKPDIVIIDYAQLLKDTGRFESERVEIGSITRKLKLMALELNIPIILLAQLNRDAQDKRPNISDLRGSGTLEQDSDNVVLLYRPSHEVIEEKFGFSMEQSYNMELNNKFPTLIMVAKQRNGMTCEIRSVFDSKSLMFMEVT